MTKLLAAAIALFALSGVAHADQVLPDNAFESAVIDVAYLIHGAPACGHADYETHAGYIAARAASQARTLDPAKVAGLAATGFGEFDTMLRLHGKAAACAELEGVLK